MATQGYWPLRTEVPPMIIKDLEDPAEPAKTIYQYYRVNYSDLKKLFTLKLYSFLTAAHGAKDSINS